MALQGAEQMGAEPVHIHSNVIMMVNFAVWWMVVGLAINLFKTQNHVLFSLGSR